MILCNTVSPSTQIGGRQPGQRLQCAVLGRRGDCPVASSHREIVLKALERRPRPVWQINGMHSPCLADYYPSFKIISFIDI